MADDGANRWYWNKNGRAEGPANEARIAELIASGALSSTDSIFKEGEDCWRTVGETPAFAPSLAEAARLKAALQAKAPSPRAAAPPPPPPAAPEEDSGAIWVLLKRKADGPGFDQSGPFTLARVKELLAKGEASYSDFIWRQGFEKWARLGDREEFAKPAKPTPPPPLPAEARLASPFAGVAASTALDDDPDPDFSEITVRKFLSEDSAVIERVKREVPAPPAEDPKPAEAFGPDLLSEKTRVMPMSPKPRPIPPSDGAPPAAGSASSLNKSIGEDFDKTVVRPRAPAKAPPAHTLQNALASGAPKLPNPIAKGAPPNEPPPGAREDDLRDELTPTPGPNWDEITPALNAVPTAPKAAARASGGDAEIEDEYPMSPMITRKRLVVGGVAAGLAVGLAIAFSGGREAPDKSARPDSPLAPKSAAKAPAPSLAPPPPPPPPPPSPSTAHDQASSPSQLSRSRNLSGNGSAQAPESARQTAGSGPARLLELVLIDADSATPRLFLRTDAPVGATIETTLRARSGEALQVPSFYKAARFARAAGDAVAVDFGPLTPGKYEWSAAVGSLRKSQTLFIGSKAAYEAGIERHLKAISLQQQTERKALYYGARRLGELARSLAKASAPGAAPIKWNAFMKKWNVAFERVKASVLDSIEPFREQLAYRSELRALGAAASKLKRQAEALNGAISQKRSTASITDGGALEAEFFRLRTTAAQLSARQSEEN